MLQGSLEEKNDENFPLLMVAGAGDAAVLAPPPNGVPIWGNANTVRTRRPWSERWPEYLSTCWMTFILLGISFMVFYAIGMLVIYRAETYLLLKCNDTKPASNVYYHNVIPRGGVFPLMAYSSYLATMAMRYPSLRFNVMFLMDDSMPYTSKRSNFYNKLYPYTSFYEEFTVYNRREVRDFQRRYPNVNITVMPLSKFMALTPLKYKWRVIPIPHLPFYARVWSVWSNGGVGLDLVIQNDLHQTGRLRSDRRTSAILRQHNDGINAERYIETLNKIEHDEETAIFSSILNMVQKMFNETFSIFNNTSPFAFGLNDPLMMRSKREVPEQENNTIDIDSNISNHSVVNIVLANTSVVNVTGGANMENVYQFSPKNETVSTDVPTDAKTEILSYDLNTKSVVQRETSNESKVDDVMQSPDSEVKKNKSEFPQVVFFYDFSIVSEPLHLDNDPQRLMSKRASQNRSLPTFPKLVTVESEGTFIAATSQMHPFLASILNAGCKRMNPKLAIKNALLTQCSGILRDDNYCNSIFIF